MLEKRSIEELAMFGGEPFSAEPIHVGQPATGDRQQFLTLVNDALERRWLTNNGPFVRELESRLAVMLDVAHCVLVSSATAGLVIALRALEVEGEVIVPAFTFAGTVHAIQWAGLTPVLCDVDVNTHNIDPARVEELITAATGAILGVHLWGRPCAIDPLASLAQNHELALLYDAAHAFGCRHEGQTIGRFGQAEVLSFHATKWFNTLEGGAIVTNSDEVAERARLMRNFGFAGLDNVVAVGTNAKMTEISAAMGLAQLSELDHMRDIYRRHHQCYRDTFEATPGLSPMEYTAENDNHGRYVVVEVDPAVIERDLLFRVLWAENIRARRYFYPGCHRIEPYRSKAEAWNQVFPASDTLSDTILCLPNNVTMTTSDIRGIASLVQFIMANATEIRERMPDNE